LAGFEACINVSVVHAIIRLQNKSLLIVGKNEVIQVEVDSNKSLSQSRQHAFDDVVVGAKLVEGNQLLIATKINLVKYDIGPEGIDLREKQVIAVGQFHHLKASKCGRIVVAQSLQENNYCLQVFSARNMVCLFTRKKE
jgi:hypothetical protein